MEQINHLYEASKQSKSMNKGSLHSIWLIKMA